MENDIQDFSSIHYKKNFLSEVIARVDLINPIEELQEQLPTKLKSQAMREFPIEEPQETIQRQFQVTPRTFSSQDLKGMVWNFHGRERHKTLTIIPNAVFVKYVKFDKYETLENDLTEFLSAFFSVYEEAEPGRLGLRYINNIEIPNGNPLQWEDYLNRTMLHLFQFYPHSEALARVFHVVEFNFDEFNLKYQFGMHNPDYPATIRRKIFILDMDAYYQGLHDPHDIRSSLLKFHYRIQELFEMSITDKLREIMNA